MGVLQTSRGSQGPAGEEKEAPEWVCRKPVTSRRVCPVLLTHPVVRPAPEPSHPRPGSGLSGESPGQDPIRVSGVCFDFLKRAFQMCMWVTSERIYPLTQTPKPNPNPNPSP